jgi:hypothetical protein
MTTAKSDQVAMLREFVGALFAGIEAGDIECRALPSRICRFYPVRRPEGLAAFVREHRHENVYVGVATRRDDRSGKLENCLQLPALYVDLDFKQTPESDARAALAGFPFPPSLIVVTGGGLHVYWLLREPLDLATDEPSARNALRRLGLRLGADLSAAECARVLRLPGSFNYKYAPPPRVGLEVCEPSRRYNLSELLEFLPEEDRAGADSGARFSMPPEDLR